MSLTELCLPVDPLATTPVRALALEWARRTVCLLLASHLPPCSAFNSGVRAHFRKHRPLLTAEEALERHPRQPDIQAASAGWCLDAFLAILLLAWTSWFWVQQIAPCLTNMPQCFSLLASGIAPPPRAPVSKTQQHHHPLHEPSCLAWPRNQGGGLSPSSPHLQSPSHAVSQFFLQESMSLELKSECLPGIRRPQHL